MLLLMALRLIMDLLKNTFSAEKEKYRGDNAKCSIFMILPGIS